MTKYFFTTLCLVAIFAGCNKAPEPPLPGREKTFQTGKWRIDGGTFTVRRPHGTDTTLSYRDYIPVCHQDDYIIFDSLMNAAVYSGDTKCDPSDAEKIPFKWRLKNSGNNIDFYNGFNNLYSARAFIQPVRFDTLVNDGTSLVIDTLVGALDTPAKGPRIVLDSIWEYRIDTFKTPQISIYDAEITDFSQSSFKLHFKVVTTYTDVTKSPWSYPAILPDTQRYEVTYKNF